MENNNNNEEEQQIIAQFVSVDENVTGPQIYLPVNATTEQLQILLNEILQNEDQENYYFRVGDEEITNTLSTFTEKRLQEGGNFEEVLKITYLPQAPFQIRPVSRCASSLEGHTEAVLAVRFSPCGRHLVSGSGDTTVRMWDLNTNTPLRTCTGHSNWVLCVEWSPNSKYFATGDVVGCLKVWDAQTGIAVFSNARAHSKYITSVCWEPHHQSLECNRLASASKDGLIKVWDFKTSRCLFSLSGHTMSVTSLRWGGEGLIMSGSQDRTIKVFSDKDGKLVRSLEGHGHWINTLALNTDYVIRTGAFDHTGRSPIDPEEAKEQALKRYMAAKSSKPERLVSGSDDFTCFIWEPSVSKKPLIRLTGHQQPINLVSFSPDGLLFATASFDKSLKLWNGITGKFVSTSPNKSTIPNLKLIIGDYIDLIRRFVGTLRGHVGAVYQVAWSSDSRLIVSGSKDSTLKLWKIASKKLLNDLPGHADEVYAVDWSPDGACVASGAKDRLLKIWKQ